MASIRQKGPEQLHAQVRRTGWPPITETLRTRKDAETWARDVESQMDRGIFVDRSALFYGKKKNGHAKRGHQTSGNIP